ncbi:MAG: phage terminase large subunit [Candidatus Saccharibacteria bacterium]|nr:phage terminase large subunit [Candidatus Saccharibacteria bacterium]
MRLTEIRKIINTPEAQQEILLELARKDFFTFCTLMQSKFYKPNREYLHEFCDSLQNFIEKSDKHFLVITMPPRHGKSLTAQDLTAWIFGQDPLTKVMTASYNEKLSTTFARSVRNIIKTQKVGKNIVYSDIFPATRVKYGEAASQQWALDGSDESSYLATAPGGTATGFGANLLIVDDLIKSAEEAYNQNVLDDHWDWFNNTFMSRTEGNWKVIIIMTRWGLGDLAGRILSAFPDDVEHISYKAVQDDGTMLCDDILSRADYDAKTKNMNLDIIEANYNQKPIDVGGRLYSSFMVWDKRPVGKIMNYTDTADTGSDYLCSINYIEYEDEAYITDLVFTDEPMEATEKQVASLLFNGDVNEAVIESNNGGRGFARNVQSIIQRDYQSNRCRVTTKTQTSNKESRILTSSGWVQNHVFMPPNWDKRYPEFYRQVMEYQRKGRNAHDDAVDVLAAIYEQVTAKAKPTVVSKYGGRIRRGQSYWG